MSILTGAKANGFLTTDNSTSAVTGLQESHALEYCSSDMGLTVSEAPHMQVTGEFACSWLHFITQACTMNITTTIQMQRWVLNTQIGVYHPLLYIIHASAYVHPRDVSSMGVAR